jgi:hypothetical protein
MRFFVRFIDNLKNLSILNSQELTDYISFINLNFFEFFLSKELREDDVDRLRIIIKGLVEVNESITYILICPSCEQICTMHVSNNNSYANMSNLAFSTQNNNFDPNTSQIFSNSFTTQNLSYFYLPVQIFEAQHLYAYNIEFLKIYVRISLRLEIEYLAANQFNRESFSNDEINLSKKILDLVVNYQKKHEEMWKDSRWIVDSINLARDKSIIKNNNNNSNINSNYFIRVVDLKDFISKLRTKTTKFTFKCEMCKSIINSIDFCYADDNLKRNIFNQISKMPNDCECKQSNNLNNFEMLDLERIGATGCVQTENDDFIVTDMTSPSSAANNSTFSPSLSPLNSISEFIDSIESNSAQKNAKIKSQHTSLTSKLYITVNACPEKSSKSVTDSAPSNKNTHKKSDSTGGANLFSYSFLSPKAVNLESSTVSNSSSSGYSSISSCNESSAHNSPNELSTSNNNNSRKFIICIKFETKLKIDFNFECTVDSKATCRDLILHSIEKINSFIDSYNELNRREVFDFQPEETTIPTTTTKKINTPKLLLKKYFRSGNSESAARKTADNPSTEGSKEIDLLSECYSDYILFVYSNDDQTKEINLSYDFLVSSLRDKPFNEKLYLKKK